MEKKFLTLSPKAMPFMFGIFAVILMLLFSLSEANPGADNSTTVCHSANCWKMSIELQGSLNTSADPCSDFEEFLCGGFRSKQQFKGQSLLQRIFVNLDYIQRTGSAYSERVTEQLVTGCWDGNCSGLGQQGLPSSTKLQVYEQLAVKAFQECALLETKVDDWSFHEMLRHNGANILDEIADLSIKGLNMRRQLRLERLMPAQSAKNFISPMTVVPGVARRDGRPALLLLSSDSFHGLSVAWPLFRNLPLQALRLMRILRLRSQRGSLVGLMRRGHSDLLLWDGPCNRTAERVVDDGSRVQTVGDAKRLLRRANLTFRLDEFLRLSLQASGHPLANDLTPLVLPDIKTFVRTVCVLERCGRRYYNLPKLLILNQICLLGMSIFTTPRNAKCLGIFFGQQNSDSSSHLIKFEGAFRPLLHGRYARTRREERLAVETEIIDLFSRIKTAYGAALDAQSWISEREKTVLKRRLQQTELKFLTEQVSEAALLQHFSGAFDSMPPRGCTISSSPACFLVRAIALQQYLILRTTQTTFDQDSPHYDLQREAVILTPAFLDYPHYLSAQPLAVRLGSQAFVLAHELTHAVFRKADNNEIDGAFYDRLKEQHGCLRQQLVDRLGLNKTSVEEDFADMIGLSVTLKLLAETVIDHEQLPGFMERYSAKQLLYIASLRIFCSKSGQEFVRHFLETGSQSWSHTPGRLRIRGVIAGDYGFSRTFNCLASKPEAGTDDCKPW